MQKLDLKHIDWLLLCFTLPIIAAGLVTMKAFVLEESGASDFFSSHVIWVGVSLVAFFVLSFFDF